jgi:hypothetical protein
VIQNLRSFIMRELSLQEVECVGGGDAVSSTFDGASNGMEIGGFGGMAGAAIVGRSIVAGAAIGGVAGAVIGGVIGYGYYYYFM